MNIVLDTNVLISALIKESAKRRLIVELDDALFFPSISFKEVYKHKNLILEKSGLKEHEFEEIFTKLKEYINLISEKELRPNLTKAMAVMEKIDATDVVFIAAALSVPNGVIWSDDKDFKRQNIVPVFNTQELIKYSKKRGI
ncbi:MAG: PIN domain-containing protein [Candidatus Hydrothermarchaeota archaeon]|nr:PIN domain-containing protein [Candidatus Hydrothermarchaeota archaeon]